MDRTELIGDKLWPIIREIIKTNIENNQSIILEGGYILPHYLKDFEKHYAEKIISVFLGYSTTYIKENFESKIIKYRSVIEDRGKIEEGDISESTIREYINENDEYKRRCLETGEGFFEIDMNYEEEIIKVYEYIELKRQVIESKFKGR